MERVEYTVDGNRLGLSIKYPSGLNRKWSEAHESIECSQCGGTRVPTKKIGEFLSIICGDCPNDWYGPIDTVLTWHDSEEASIRLRKIPFESHE